MNTISQEFKEALEEYLRNKFGDLIEGGGYNFDEIADATASILDDELSAVEDLIADTLSNEISSKMLDEGDD